MHDLCIGDDTMGYMSNPSGVTKIFRYDDGGANIDTFFLTRSLFTTRVQQGNEPPSSQDWLKQIYVADSDEGLSKLLTLEPVAHEEAPATSGASRKVTFCIAKGDSAEVLHDQTVIAIGDPVPSTDNKPIF